MQTLFDEIGGRETIEQFVTAFYQRVLGDALLSPFFEDTSIEKLKRMQISFFTIALGGDEPESNKSIYEAHCGRGIQRQHLGRFTEHLIATLQDIGIEDDNVKKIYQRISTYADDVLGDTSVDG